MYRIVDNYLEVVGTKGKVFYKIVSVSADGIIIENESDNGAQITETIPYNKIN